MRVFADYSGSSQRAAGSAAEEHALYVRVRGEYREMPGLRLTLRQAVRLFASEPGRCERVLSALVEDGVLVNNGSVFARAS